MAQRILLELDALDKYSQDLLAKHAKKRSLSYLQRIPPLRAPRLLDFEEEIDLDLDGRTSSRKASTPTSSRYPLNAELGRTLHLRPFTASGYCVMQEYEREKGGLKKLTRSRCVSADRRRSWRSEVDSIPDLDTLCHMGRTGPVLSGLGAAFPGEMMQDSSRAVEKSEEPPCGDNTRPERTTLLPDTYEYSEAQRASEHSHPCRNHPQKAAAISLCLEDEMMKPDAKIITVRQRKISRHVQNVSETHPVIYNSPITRLSDFQRNLSTRPYYFTSSQRPMGKPCSPGGPLLQNKMDSLRSSQLGLQDIMIKKSKTDKMSLSENTTVILHYLSADGTKQRVEVAKDGNVAKQKQGNSPTNRKTFVQDGKSILISQSKERSDEEHGVGPVVNGINPMIAMDYVPSSHGRSHQTQRLICPSSARTSSSSIQRPNSVKEIHSWSYISISKALSPPDGPPEPLQNKTSSPDLVKDVAMPTSGMGPMIFTTKSMILENRNGRPGTPVDVNPTGTYLVPERSTEGPQEEGKMEGDGTVVSTNTTDMLEITSHKKESNEEQVQNKLPTPVHLSTIPVISIPTATTDNAE
ncbi:uncharacterized protein C1orf141 homolog [Dendropsophus ebraccatus]|uniref:uncharacterized protein C1orf141 homolog n=1 Tax=Dendropsophus ebraccatus TaxID=150705 RepID=UPI0038316201